MRGLFFVHGFKHIQIFPCMANLSMLKFIPTQHTSLRHRPGGSLSKN
nr:MAG TPA: hypothetical protein [Caudoviricetes sp.]